MLYPERSKYMEDAKKYSIIPVFSEMRTDFDTPVSIFHKVHGDSLLESVESGENVGRYSFITIGRIADMYLHGNSIIISEYDAGKIINREKTTVDNPLLKVKEYITGHRVPEYPGLPPLFGGALGYLGFEAMKYFENVPVKEAGDHSIPDGILVTPEVSLVYDMVKRSVTIVVSSVPGTNPEKSYRRAEVLTETVIEQLQLPVSGMYKGEKKGRTGSMEVTSNVSKSTFLDNVAYCKEQIVNGEIIQVVLSRKFKVKTDIDPFSLYRTLRVMNPSPYLYYLDFNDFHLIGSSPEVMVRLQKGELLLKPIAGTRKRGLSVEEDNRLAGELLADPKERAEHLMLVDLGRNDLGRISVPGSVKVTNYMAVEKYSHVMHIVSTVRGELDSGYDLFDVIRSVFPAGTLSGAPKIRAVEIINEVEKERRESYGGMILFIGFNGNLESCITIRTILLKDGVATIQAGAGIVADSVPEQEYEETKNKAMALLQTIKEASH